MGQVDSSYMGQADSLYMGQADSSYVGQADSLYLRQEAEGRLIQRPEADYLTFGEPCPVESQCQMAHSHIIFTVVSTFIRR